MSDDVFSSLKAQTDRLDAILDGLDDDQWSAPSLCPGWSVCDVVLHLAQTEEGVAATIEGSDMVIPSEGASNIDEAMEHWVRAERGASPEDVHARWNEARTKALEALRVADPGTPLTWAAAPLRPKTLATTRLSEHWIHTMDIAEPLGIDNPDTDDISHLAWLAVKTIPYAFARAGRDDPPTVRAALVGPSGDRWSYGPDQAACTIAGPASEFVRVAARRISPAEATGLTGTGEKADDVLELVRTYA
jgi:uncharacterized protein (TIGR03084 family)